MYVIETGRNSHIVSTSVSPCSEWLAVLLQGWTTFAVTGKQWVGVWNLRNPSLKPTRIETVAARDVVFLPNGQLLINDSGPDGVTVREFPGRHEPRQLVRGAIPSYELLHATTNRLYLSKTTITANRNRQLQYHCYSLETMKRCTLKKTWLAYDEAFAASSPTWEPNGEHVAAFLVNSPQIHAFVPRPDRTKPTLEVRLSIWRKQGHELAASEVQLFSNAWGLTYSPDGSTLVALNDQKLFVWNAETLKRTQTIAVLSKAEIPRDVCGLRLSRARFSSDGRHLAIGCIDGAVRIIETSTWTESHAYDCHQAIAGARQRNELESVQDVHYTPDGTMLLAVTEFDIVLWDL